MGRMKRHDGTKWVDVAPSAQEFDEHKANDVHLQAGERETWNNKIDSSQKGVANGVATIGSDGKVPKSQFDAMGKDPLVKRLLDTNRVIGMPGGYVYVTSWTYLQSTIFGNNPNGWTKINSVSFTFNNDYTSAYAYVRFYYKIENGSKVYFADESAQGTMKRSRTFDLNIQGRWIEIGFEGKSSIQDRSTNVTEVKVNMEDWDVYTLYEMERR